MTPEAEFALGVFAILAILWLGYVVINGLASRCEERYDPEYDSHYLAEDEEEESEQGTPEQRG